jgi:mono/diheme cytochrome c family protein
VAKVILSVMSIIIASMMYSKAFTSNEKKHPGKLLYKKYNCNSCHGNKGTSPFDLTDANEEYTYDKLKLYIDNPKAYGNHKMPAFKGIISENEYKDLISYIIVLHQGQLK